MRTNIVSAAVLFLFALPVLLAAQALPYSQLDPKPYDPATDPNPDMYMGSWTESMPIKTHGAIIERAILTKGDPMNPPTKGAVLKYTNRFVRASIGAYESTQPVTLDGEQEIFYVLSGTGTISSKGKISDLRQGIAVLIPSGVEFTMTNTGAETLAMYLIVEPVPPGFKGNTEIRIVDENKQAWNTGNPHWVGLSKPIFSTATGLRGSMFEMTILTVAMMGTARKVPTIPQTYPQKKSEKMMTMGERLKRFPIISGSR